MPILTVTLFLPLLGALVVLFLSPHDPGRIRRVTLAFAGLTFLSSLAILSYFDFGRREIQLVEEAAWIPAIGVQYKVGVDSMSLALAILTTLLTLLSVIYSLRVEERVKEYNLLFLLLETGMLGVFFALDFFLFYVFWELTLVPMYFLIGIWGGARREYAAIKFFLYTLVGSLAMLLAILLLYFHLPPGERTFDVLRILEARPLAGTGLLAQLAFWGFFLSFAIKVPMWPFHTWLPDAHVEAPTAGSVILAAILLKLGTYGFVRFSLPLFPEIFQQHASLIATLAVIGVIYGALVAMAQQDLKKLVAYSSVNHMGYVMLAVAAAAAARGRPELMGPAATALNGAVLEMLAHGVITGALFLIVGVIYDYRTHTRGVEDFGGLWAVLPKYGAVTITAMFASLGLPGLMGFVAEFLIFVGSFAILPVHTALAAIGIIVTAAFFLWTIQRIFLGPTNPRWGDLPDLDRREAWSLIPLVILMIVFGVYPRPLVEFINLSTTQVMQLVGLVR
ncbi:MAG: NADH-quinone oxidoreductase subunit M [Armatimonadota bacterium]|nr:NADH-quinone oxidoreductase subunit M [Armatimonadota bacterium]MDR7614945.1 NADH-quinone oxidoreductase subunit M [Armatimonadota bacterium]